MTIQELYDRALAHGSEDYEVLIFDQWEEYAIPLTEGKLAVNNKDKKVIIEY